MVHIYSSEGVTQGDPISLFMYAVGTLPLIRILKSIENCIQVWYADDSSVCGNLLSLRNWLCQLIKLGPHYGYYPEPPKCYLIVHESQLDIARNIFSDTGVHVVTGSSEGVTQGDPISLFMYAVGTLPLIRILKSIEHCIQLWYADDSSVCGKIQ